MTVGLQPSVWVEFRLDEYPSGTITTYKWSARPLADSGSWKEGRVASWAAIDRALSSLDGEYELGKMTIILDDQDGLLRGLLSAATTQYFTSREAAVMLLSESGRAAALTPRMLRRGFVTDVQATRGRQVSLEITDLVGSHFHGFDLDKMVPQITIGDEHPNAPLTSRGLVYPIYTGEQSDIGVVDENGDPADKGLCPAIYVGLSDITGAGQPASYADLPTITDSGTVGATTGEQTHYYAASVITPYGESMLSNVATVNGAANRSLLNYNYISGTFDSGDPSSSININKVRIWHSNDGVTFSGSLGEADYNGVGVFGFADGAAPWPTPTRDEIHSETHVTPPDTNQALASDDHWGMFVVSLGALKDILAVYASDLADGGPPKRVRLTTDLDGVEFMTPQSADWPHPNPYVELTNPVTGETIRQTVIYLRGPRLRHAIDGAISVAVNLCGAEDVGDGSGLMIEDAFKQLQWFLNEHVLKTNGKGYRSGNWGPLVTYANGDAQVWTSKFADAQTQTITWIGGRGYLGHIALTEPLSVREFIRRFCITFNCLMGANHWGQIFPVVINDSASATAGRLYRDQIEIIELEGSHLDHARVQTKVEYSFDWDADARVFRVTDQALEHTSATAAHTVVRRGPLRKCHYTRDEATADDSNERFLMLVKRAPGYATWRTDCTGLMDELGSQVRFNHYDYVTPSTTTPMLILRTHTDPDAPQTVTLTALDLGRLLASVGFWGPDDLPAYADATDEQRAAYAFWTDDDDQVSTTVEGKEWR